MIIVFIIFPKIRVLYSKTRVLYSKIRVLYSKTRVLYFKIRVFYSMIRVFYPKLSFSNFRLNYVKNDLQIPVEKIEIFHILFRGQK